MSCCSGDSALAVLECPQCGISCKKISMKTVFHQVKFPDILDVDIANYYYCADKTCSVGYFSQPGKTILKNQLRAFTELKNNKLCYCFDINTEQYVNSLKDETASTIKIFVIQKTKAGDCACEIRNPSGQCCLADFKQLEKIFKLDK
ncbi:MAG: putative iron-sulfur cluster-binding metallochaperone [Methylococcaceae bacterium]